MVYLDGLKTFGQDVHNHLWESIQAAYNLSDTPANKRKVAADALAEEADYHRRFMESWLRVYVGREPIQRTLMKVADSNPKALFLVTGPSGLGKSAAMAKDARHCNANISTWKTTIK